MIELKKDFSKGGGRVFHQLYKDAALVLYEVKQSCITFYEVFRPRLGKANSLIAEDFERYPSDESFGVWAWCCSSVSHLKKVIDEKWYHHPIAERLDLLTSCG